MKSLGYCLSIIVVTSTIWSSEKYENPFNNRLSAEDATDQTISYVVSMLSNVDNPEVKRSILEIANDSKTLDWRVSADNIKHAFLDDKPYSGWVKVLLVSGELRSLFQLKSGVAHGLHVHWYKNGQKMEQAKWVSGKRNGLTTHWYPNGNMKRQELWKHGVKEGPFKEWYETGEKEEEGTWKQGKLEGENILWHINGKKKAKANYSDGKKEGLLQAWYENGKKKLEFRNKNDLKDGLFLSWNDNGQKISATNYREGKKEGLGKSWYNNGQKKIECLWKGNLLITAEKWKPNGEKCPTTNVVNGNGIWVSYNEDGTEKLRATFENGQTFSD